MFNCKYRLFSALPVEIFGDGMVWQSEKSVIRERYLIDIHSYFAKQRKKNKRDISASVTTFKT